MIIHIEKEMKVSIIIDGKEIWKGVLTEAGITVTSPAKEGLKFRKVREVSTQREYVISSQ
jgi:hypothetical protein